MKTFYRIANTDTNQGLWYNMEGKFTGLIHTQFDFCKNSELPMPFDEKIKNYLSATETLDELYEWFPQEDILKLNAFGYLITIYEAEDYKFHNNHWIINKNTSKITCRINTEFLQSI